MASSDRKEMKTVEISLDILETAPWNANVMDSESLIRLTNSIKRFDLVVPLVVRPVKNHYQVINGNQRLQVLKDLNRRYAPCVVINADDDEAMLLAESLNEIHGQDDLSLKGKLFKRILQKIPENTVLSLLPETAESLKSLSHIGEVSLAEHLQAWQTAQAARLRHMQLQLTSKQFDVVQEAVNSILPEVKNSSSSNPNPRGNAIYNICKFYMERRSVE